MDPKHSIVEGLDCIFNQVLSRVFLWILYSTQQAHHVHTFFQNLEIPGKMIRNNRTTTER